AARGTRMLLLSPFVWVASELGRTYVFTGFPWVLLGYSQKTTLPIAQLASVFGVYGVSWIVALVSAAAVSAFIGRGAVTARVVPLAAALLLVGVVAAWGSRRLVRGDLTRTGDPIRVGLIQGNVDQAIKWDPAMAATIFQDYIAKTREAILRGASLVIWPESSTPFRLEEDPAGAEVVRTIARQARVPILLGSDQIESGSPATFYNSAFMI